MDTPDNVITILEARLDEAQEHLQKLANKAQRYGTPRITWTLGEVREEERQDNNGRKVKVQYRDIILNELEAPRVGDFQFIARLEITEAGTIIVSIPGEELPKHFRDCDGVCQHCHQDRARKHLFVVRDPEGNLVQVGRTCLRDYMGTDTPTSVAARFRWERELSEWSDEWGGSGGVVQDSAEELLAVTSVAIRLWGWVAKSNPDETLTPTAFAIAPWFYCAPSDKTGKAMRDEMKAAITEDDWATARATLEWIADEAESGDSEYIHNVRMVLAPGVVPPARRGIACSAVAALQRHLGKLAERQRRAAAAAEAAEVSRHVGEAVERLRDLQLRCDSARGMDSHWGTTILYKFHDRAGNVLTWFSSGGAELEPGREYTVDATVKGHSEFQGVAETTLTRARVKEQRQS